MRMISGDSIRKAIDRLYRNGAGIVEIEDWINDLPGPDEAKAAAWLYAWSCQPPAIQRSDALDMLLATHP